MKEFAIYTNKNQFKGTCYIEIFPGRNNHKHWNDESVYIFIDAIDVIYDILVKVNKHFNQYNNTYFHRTKLKFLFYELSIRINDIKNEYKINKNNKYRKLIKYLAKDYYNYINVIIKENRNDIIIMLEDLLKWLKINRKKGITIIGI